MPARQRQWGQKAPSAIRCIKTSGSRQAHTRCHPHQKAPSAIRRIKTPPSAVLRGPPSCVGQKAPSAIRRIKTSRRHATRRTRGRSESPSAIRCIKTSPAGGPKCSPSDVRKHRAPKGALRLVVVVVKEHQVRVRKHQAPKGALRHTKLVLFVRPLDFCQKAPSTIRCIENRPPTPPATPGSRIRRPSPRPQRVATRKLHEFVPELGTCLHGMNEECSATIETNTTSSRTCPDWSIPTTSHHLGSSSSSRGREFRAYPYTDGTASLVNLVRTRSAHAYWHEPRGNRAILAPPRQKRQNGSRSPRGQWVP